MSARFQLRNGKLSFLCPSCGHVHCVPVDGSRGWAWNPQTLTLTPSVKNSIQKVWLEGKPWVTVCHLFIQRGNIVYCEDTPTAFAGKTVPLPDLPEDWEFHKGERGQ